VAEQNRIRQGALAKQVQLVFRRSEIYRPEILRRDFAVGCHCESGNDEWAAATHEKENAQRSTSNVQYLIF
jgi:hypothetical protein